MTEKRISVVIPNYNKASTIGKCLEAAYASDYKNFEIIVVDDCSDDNSVDIIRGFPCRLITLGRRSGASVARNTGARNSSGEYIFFTDSDCLLRKDTLPTINRTISAVCGQGNTMDCPVIIGGTYTRLPYDEGFFNTFQSVFVNYSETRREVPDYIAAHAMIIASETFRGSGGFPEDFLPIIEDVEFTHRLKRQGYRLVMAPEIQVRHIFGFTLMTSIRNAYRKSKYWNMYSLKNKDVLSDSGSASFELKINCLSSFINMVLLALWMVSGRPVFLEAIPFLFMVNAAVNRRQMRAFYETKGFTFAVGAFLYYTLLYPIPISAGAIAGAVEYYYPARRSGR